MLTKHKLTVLLLTTFFTFTAFAQSEDTSFTESANLPVKQGKVEVNVGNLYYEEAGVGEPLILVHSHFLTSEMWEEQFYELAAHFRVIRYDLRGYGNSSSLMGSAFCNHTDDLLRLMYALDIDKAHLIGSCFGAAVVMDMVGLYPEKVLSAVLVNGNIGNFLSNDMPSTPERDILSQISIDYTTYELDSARNSIINELIKTGGSTRETLREKLRTMVNGWDGWLLFNKEVKTVSGREAYTEIQRKRPALPVLIIEGRSENNKFPKKPDLLQYLPQAKMLVLYNGGILVNMEVPEAFNKAIIDFMK